MKGLAMVDEQKIIILNILCLLCVNGMMAMEREGVQQGTLMGYCLVEVVKDELNSLYSAHEQEPDYEMKDDLRKRIKAHENYLKTLIVSLEQGESKEQLKVIPVKIAKTQSRKKKQEFRCASEGSLNTKSKSKESKRALSLPTEIEQSPKIFEKKSKPIEKMSFKDIKKQVEENSYGHSQMPPAIYGSKILINARQARIKTES